MADLPYFGSDWRAKILEEPAPLDKPNPLSTTEPLAPWEDIPGRSAFDTPVPTWTKLARESDSDWALFLAYRNSAYPEGPQGRFVPRDLLRIATEVGLPLNHVEGLAASFAWARRAGAYDRAVDTARASTTQDTPVDASRRRTERITAKARSLVEKELDKLLEKAERLGEVGALRPAELEKIMQLVFRMERELHAPKTNEASETLQDEYDLDSLSIEDLVSLRDTMLKAAKH